MRVPFRQVSWLVDCACPLEDCTRVFQERRSNLHVVHELANTSHVSTMSLRGGNLNCAPPIVYCTREPV